MVDCAEHLIRMNPSACNEYDKDGLAPLHHAARGNHVKIIQSLINAGAGKEDISSLILVSCQVSDLFCTVTFVAHVVPEK